MTMIVILATSFAIMASLLSIWLSVRSAAQMYRAQDALHVKLAASRRESGADGDATMASLRERLEVLLRELSANEQAKRDPSVRHEFVDVFREVIDRLPEDKRKTLRVLQEQPFDQQVRLVQRFVA